VYYPFRGMIEANGRITEVSELKSNGRTHYEFDFEDLDQKLAADDVKLFILCSPHNPVSRVWTREELLKIAHLCAKNNVPVVSDEIHSDLVYGGHNNTPFALVADELRDNFVICTAPTKTFNMAGIQASNVIAKNPELRKKINRAMEATGCFEPNWMGMAALKGAYNEGEEWLEELLKYLEHNVEIVREELAKTDGKVKLVEPEGTYLLWLDCSALNMDDKALDEFFVHKTGLRFDAGTMFGESGSGFTRMNIACPEKTLREALERIVNAVKEL
ncbi:MAG: aminotransferase class I/II-fold pyridoxal phosphate-dependent enzyme, partial [Firmicutes bacterium]|nr:aminotransferase class I/II-fold pyridoxal phosphate-dependent enzyme [Bacillota bacterium]